ncbi:MULTISPECIES: fimbrial protein [unclassified Enterobacter cloacae complex]|uniref:fimbrial protein n=1 Tax=unclassified Enterobacter cloacae complex TaxID=2757714 RepID=UPI001868C909|nr:MULTISPECIES: fimbrial protein [unclassified Enterobacter cloacae complex]MBE3468106.1 fimbrial protein [Enterobacter cloacae complex sp. P15RS]MBE3513329.1 fimbrial protein [Enterobacter cloacae complex sp. I2]
MKRYQRGTLSLLLFLATAGVQASPDNVHFTGNLLGGICKMEMQNGVLDTVTFPDIAASDLMLRGHSARQPVRLRLYDCPPSVQKNGVRVTFHGTEVTGMRGFLAFDATSIASGVGIGLEMLNGVSVLVNDPVGATFPLADGNNDLMLNAWLQVIPGQDVLSGTFTATSTVIFEYL